MAAVDADDRLRRFKKDLPLYDDPTLVQRHITFGDCFVLDEDNHFGLKMAVAARWGLHPSEVIVVGSAKLGFSIAPQKLYRSFSDQSDVDVAVVSERLFDDIWQEVYNYDRGGGYWPDRDLFQRYLFRGWVRPDLLPPSKLFTTGSEWWEFFRSLTEGGTFGPYKLRGAIYKSWFFLERYQERAVSNCRLKGEGQ